jgi:hypothetical protein
MSPAAKLRALRRAEKALRDLNWSHPYTCSCGICTAWSATWRVMRSIEQPGCGAWVLPVGEEVRP